MLLCAKSMALAVVNVVIDAIIIVQSSILVAVCSLDGYGCWWSDRVRCWWYLTQYSHPKYTFLIIAFVDAVNADRGEIQKKLDVKNPDFCH